MLHSILATGGPAAGPSFLTGLVPLLIIVGIFYLLIWRPMKVRQKNHEALIAGLKNGDKVITTGGIHGIVAGIRDNTLLVKVADKVKLEIAKSSVASLQTEDTSSDS
ncbi:MAG TPA: preprotein translocase subunit YajC [Acidobacteriota bacterium]|nr:preprotein translocase subunit YajC [Acidobacteriota bacterium]